MFSGKETRFRRGTEGSSWGRRPRLRTHALRLLLPFALALPPLALVIDASAPDAAAAAPGQQIETNISNNADGGAGTTTMGEPEIAQNPLNRNNLFIDWNTFDYPVTNMTPVPNPCGGMRSMDRGQTWQPQPCH